MDVEEGVSVNINSHGLQVSLVQRGLLRCYRRLVCRGMLQAHFQLAFSESLTVQLSRNFFFFLNKSDYYSLASYFYYTAGKEMTLLGCWRVLHSQGSSLLNKGTAILYYP